LKSAEGDADLCEVFLGEKCAQRDSAQDDDAGNDQSRATPAIHKEEDERQEEIKLVFDREGPRVRKSSAAMESDVLHRDEKLPERLRHFRIFAPRRQQKVNGEDDEVGWKNPQGATREKPSKVDAVSAREWREQLAADEVSAKDKEKIDTDPAKAVHTAGQRKAHNTGVVDDYHDNGERAEEIEAGLAFAIGEARVDDSLVFGSVSSHL
jgi:hypothetical protein